jgi:hypothetical protein
MKTKKNPTLQEFEKLPTNLKYYWKKKHPDIYGEIQKKGTPPTMEKWLTFPLHMKQRYTRLFPDVFPKATPKTIPTLEEFENMPYQTALYWRKKHPDIYGKPRKIRTKNTKPTLEEFLDMKPNLQRYYKNRYPEQYPVHPSHKNFHIVRYYLNDEVQFVTSLTERQAAEYGDYVKTKNLNEAGGFTIWYRMDIQPVKKVV